MQIRPLGGGITNRNFVVTTDHGEYVVRIPGERTALLGIDRAYEAEAARRAADLGIGPAVLGMLEEVGTLVTELVDGHHLEPTPFGERLEDVVDLIHRFHDSGPLGGAFPIHRIVEWHARDASAHGVMAPNSYERLHQQSRRIEAAFARSPMPTVPCHNDLLPGNVLFADDRVWLLDFEYAGMNDVFFDLGNLSVNSELSARSGGTTADPLLRADHQVVVGAAAVDEDDERVSRRHVGRRAAGHQLARHRLRVVCQRAARATASVWQADRSSRAGSRTRRIRID